MPTQVSCAYLGTGRWDRSGSEKEGSRCHCSGASTEIVDAEGATRADGMAVVVDAGEAAAAVENSAGLVAAEVVVDGGKDPHSPSF